MSHGQPCDRASDWRHLVLRFWFGLNPRQWFESDPALDQEIREGFLDLWTDKRRLPVGEFLSDPLTALAGVILFDQFPRNMFRGHADQFSTDCLAVQIARGAVDASFDDALEEDERAFLYMPFQHSESMADQDRSLLLFTALENANYLDYAKKHRSLIKRFGRFPHRNAMLGRSPRPDETAAGDVDPF